MTALQVSAQKQLKTFIDRIENVEQQRKDLADDVKEIFAEAKGVGFDVKIIRKVIAIRKKSQREWQEEEAILSTYLEAVGMFIGTPMGEYIEEQKRIESGTPVYAEAN